LISLIIGGNKRIPDAQRIFHAKFPGGNQKMVDTALRSKGARANEARQSGVEAG
jgi:hypothetical protein